MKETRLVQTAIWNTFKLIPGHMVQHMLRRLDISDPGSYYTNSEASGLLDALMDADWRESDAKYHHVLPGCQLYHAFLPGYQRASAISEVPDDTRFVVRLKDDAVSVEAYHPSLAEGKRHEVTYLIVGEVKGFAKPYMDHFGHKYSLNKDGKPRSSCISRTKVVYTFHPGPPLPSGLELATAMRQSFADEKEYQSAQERFTRLSFSKEQLGRYFPGVNYCVWCGIEPEHDSVQPFNEEEDTYPVYRPPTKEEE